MTDLTSSSFPPPAVGEPKMEIGNVWRLTFQTFRRAPWRFIAFAILPGVFSIILSLFTVPFRHDRDAAGIALTIGVVVFVAQLAFQLVTQSGGIYAAGRVLAGGNFTIGESLGVGLRRFWPALVLIILLLLIIAIGYLALIIPGIIAGLILAVAYQVCVIEGRGPIESMQRSAYLTKGNRLRIFGAYLLVLIMPMVAVFVVFAILAALVGAFVGQNNHVAVAMFSGVGLLLMFPFFLFIGALVNILLAVIFVELRRVKEGGFAREAVATVFD